MKTSVLFAGLLGGALALMAGCSTTPAQSDAEKVSRVSSQRTGTTTKTSEEGEELICRKDYATGSRVKFTEICGTEEDWERMDSETRDFMKDNTSKRAASNSR